VSDFRKEIELLVRANLGSSRQTLQSFTRSIGDVSRELDRQTEAAKRGESALDELKGTQAALDTVQRQLLSKADLIGNYTKLAEVIATTEARVTRTAKAYEDYKKKLDAAESVSDKQQASLIKKAQAHERAQRDLQRHTDTQVRLTAAMNEAGIETANLAQAETRVRDAAAQIAVLMTRAGDAVRSYAEDVRKARAAERELQNTRAFEDKISQARQLAAAQKSAQSADYISWWNATLTAAEKAAEAYKKTATDALAATKQYQTLARAAADLSPKVVTLRDAVNSIINPAGAARATLGGVETQVQELATAVAAIKGPVKDYEATFKQLTEAQKALGQQATLVDNFRQQATALRLARAEFVAARASVAQYAVEVAKGGEGGERFAKSLADAQLRAKQAAAALKEQITATRTARDELRQAGVATNDLAGAETRLVNATRAATSTVKQLTAAVDEYGQSTQRSRRGGGIFGDEGRTTLSFVQRLRGEILALATAYVGLQGGINLARSALDAFNTRQGAQNQLSLSVGSEKAAIDAEYEYIKAQADRIGVEVESVLKNFAKFSAAGSLAGRSRAEIRFITETFMELSRVANLSGQDLDGVFKAIEQIFSKGKIQAEELRGQIGDRLFGAFQVAAQALKGTFPDLDKALKEGSVSADQFLAIATKYRDMVKDQLPAATKSLAAEQARMTNAVFDFKLAVADAGFADAWIKALQEMTSFFKSTDGKEFANNLSRLFELVAQAIVIVLKNLDALIIAGGAWFAVMAASRFQSLITDLRAVGVQATLTAATFKSLSTWVGIFQAAVAGWAVGTIIYEKFAIVRKAAALLVTGLDEAWVTIKHSFGAAFDALPIIAKNAMAFLFNTVLDAAKKVTGIFAKIARAGGLDGIADSLEASINAAVGIGTESVDAAIRARREQLKRELGEIRRIRGEMLSDIDNPPPGGAPKTDGAGNPTPQPPFSPARPGPSEGDIKKRENEIDRIRKALEDLEARTEKSKNDSLDAQLKAFDLKTAELKRDIIKLGGTEGKKFLEQFETLRLAARNEIVRKYNDELLKEQESLNRKIESAEASAGRRDKFALQDRLRAIEQSYEATYREIAATREKLLANNRSTEPADAAKSRLDAAVAELKVLESRKFATEELKRKEEAINAAIKLRDDQIKVIREQQELGSIDDLQAAERINAINAAAVPSIQGAATAAKEWAIAHKEIFATPELLEVFLAQMDTLSGKVANVKQEFGTIGQTIITSGQGAITQGFDAIVNGLGEIITKQKSAAQGFKDIGRATLGIFAQFLRDIAIAILKLQIFNLMKQSGNPYIAAIGAAGAASVGVNHSGGIIGAATNRRRSVSSAWFANAPRYHAGGFPGLAQNEVPAILEKGEEVLDKSSPRNALNGGAGGAAAQQQRGMRFVFLDDRSKVAEAMASAEGDEVIVQSIRRNASTIRQFVK
jgi:tape measure domain-containing protein